MWSDHLGRIKVCSDHSGTSIYNGQKHTETVEEQFLWEAVDKEEEAEEDQEQSLLMKFGQLLYTMLCSWDDN